MSKGKALKLSDVERIHADLIKHDEARLAIAKKYRITLETLNKINRVRKIAGKYGTDAALRVRGHKIPKQSDQAEC
jgi:Trp operon repressor